VSGRVGSRAGSWPRCVTGHRRSTDRRLNLGTDGGEICLTAMTRLCRTQIERFRGREVRRREWLRGHVRQSGRAIECALSHQGRAGRPRRWQCGRHPYRGDRIRGDDVAGMAVHIGARVSALAVPARCSSHRPPRISLWSTVDFEERGEDGTQGRAGNVASFAVTA